MFVYCSKKKRYIEDFAKPKTEQDQAFSLLIPCRSIIFVVFFFLLCIFAMFLLNSWFLYAVCERRLRTESKDFFWSRNKEVIFLYLPFFSEILWIQSRGLGSFKYLWLTHWKFRSVYAGKYCLNKKWFSESYIFHAYNIQLSKKVPHCNHANSNLKGSSNPN